MYQFVTMPHDDNQPYVSQECVTCNRDCRSSATGKDHAGRGKVCFMVQYISVLTEVSCLGIVHAFSPGMKGGLR